MLQTKDETYNRPDKVDWLPDKIHFVDVFGYWWLLFPDFVALAIHSDCKCISYDLWVVAKIHTVLEWDVIVLAVLSTCENNLFGAAWLLLEF